MRKLAVLTLIAALLVVSAQTFGRSTTKNCGGPSKVHAHGLSCKAAKKNLKKGSPGYDCRPVGQTKKPPFTIKCQKMTKPKVWYTFQTNGG